MTYYLICVWTFAFFYLLSLFYVSVFYHRGLTHGAVKLRPWARQWVIWSGNWVTGMDPKAWSCMHRLHHQHSDTPLDPHSPVHQGLFRLMLGQLRSYQRTLRGLIRRQEPYASLSTDLNFPVSWLNRNRLWFLPYLAHATLAILIGLLSHAWLLAFAYWLGIMSHPIQGWMVNALGHSFGYRNYPTADRSKNNLLVAWLVMGEGYQNNHHHQPSSAKFSVKWWEFDLGYYFCILAERFGVLERSVPAVKS